MTSSLFWYSALVTAVLDVALVAVLVQRLKVSDFGRIGLGVAAAGAVFWTALWTVMMVSYWEDFYSYLFPPLLRSYPVVLGLAYGAVGTGVWHIARRLPGNPILGFCLLGGIEGLVSHIWAIGVLGALTKPPAMEGVSAASVLTFAFFEKVLYWSLVLLLASMLYRLYGFMTSRSRVGRRDASA